MSRVPPLKSIYAELCLPPSNADAAWNRARGYRFEKLLVDLLEADRLDPRASYKAAGEQIDGSFFLDGAVFLFEAKWHAEPIPASVLYEFKGKVDGKLVGTLGVVLSMSGYSQDAVDALTLGKSLNLILFDKRDIDAAIERELGFREVLRRKLRKAAEEGVIYFPAEADLITSKASIQVDIENLGFDAATGSIFARTAPASLAPSLVVLCEGDIDREVVAHLTRRILERTHSKKSIKLLAAMGKVSIPRVANAIHESVDPHAKVLIVVDGDDDIDRTARMLARGISFSNWSAAIPNPEIEIWLGLDRRKLQAAGRESRLQQAIGAADSLDMDELRQKDSAFSEFYEAISEI